MTQHQRERRHHARFSLGLPVRVRLPGQREPILVELMDISESGARFQAGDNSSDVRVSERVVFGFVVPDQPSCHATGQVLRVDRSGQFVLALDGANPSFVGFIRLLCAES
jgi:PilZ domain